MSAKQELRDLVERLSEAEAARLLARIGQGNRRGLPTANEPRRPDPEALQALFDEWRRAGEAVDEDEVRAYDEMLENLTPVRFREIGDW